MATQFPLVQGQPLDISFPGLGFPAPQNAAQAPPPVAAPVQPAQEPGFFDKLTANPDLLAALLQFSGAALKPAGPGESPISVIGGAAGNAAQNFIKNTGARDERGIKRETIAESKRKDTETNPSEASKINLDNAMIEYYGRLPTSTKASGGKVDVWNDSGFLRSLIKTKPNINTLEEAQTFAFEYFVTKGLVDPSIASKEFLNRVGGNTVFNQEGLQGGIDTMQNLTYPGDQNILKNATPAEISEAMRVNPEGMRKTYGPDAILDALLRTGK